MYEPTTCIPNQPPPLKQRHLCLTAYLVLMIIANLHASTYYYLMGFTVIRQEIPNNPNWAFQILFIGGIFNIVCAIALFWWKKWGFWGFVGSSSIAFFISLSTGGLGFSSTLVGLLGIAFLYGVLHIGNERKGWSQIE